MLKHVLPNLQKNSQAVKPRDTDWKNKGVLRKFDQKTMLEYTRTNVLMFDGLDFDGFVYYPNTCTDNNGAAKCKIHFALHGCNEMLNSLSGWNYMRRTGLNEYAVTNNLIIVYPQVAYALFRIPCFDFYGDVDQTNYLFKDSVQSVAFMNMIDRLAKPMDSDQWDYGMDSNMNDDSGLEESWKEFVRIWWNWPGLTAQFLNFSIQFLLSGFIE